MGKSKISAVIALDGEKKFKDSVRSANGELRNLEAESRLVTETFAGQANTLQALTAKHDILTKTLEAQKKKRDQVSAGLSHAREAQEKVRAGLEKLRQQQEKEQRAMEEMKDSTGTTSDELKEQERRLEELAAAIRDGERNYETAGRRVQNWERDLNNASAEVLRANRALEENDACMEEARRSADHCAMSIDEFGRQASQAETETRSLGAAVDMALGSLAANVVTRAFDEIIDLSRRAVEGVYDVGTAFTSEMSNVEALSGAVGSELEALEEKAKEMGAATKLSASQSAEAFGYMALAGWDTDEMLAGIEGTMNAAAASAMELGDVSDILTDAITAFGDSAADANRYADVLSTTQAKSNTTVSALGEAYKNVAATAGAYGYSVEETSAALGVLANAGIKGSEAGTNLSIIMSRLATNTNGAQDELRSLGVEFYNADGSTREFHEVITGLTDATADMTDQEKASIVTKIAGKNAQKSLNAIIGQGTEAYNDLYGKLLDCDGASAKMAETMNNNLSGKLAIMNNALEAVGLTIYEKFEGPLMEAVEHGTEGINLLNDEIAYGPLSGSLEGLAEKTGEVAEEMIDFGMKAIPKVTKGLSWMLAHGDGIISILKGIGAGLAALAVTKGVSKMVGVMEQFRDVAQGVIAKVRSAATAQQVQTTATAAQTAATTAQTAATEAATVAQQGLNAAQKANAIGAMISLAIALGTAIYSYCKKTQEANDGTKEFLDTLDRQTESIKSNIQSIGESASETQASWEANDRLLEKLLELNGVAEKTSSQRYEEKAIVEQLSDQIPELAEAYDEQAGKIALTDEQIRKLYESSKEYARFQASQSIMQEYTEEAVKAEMALKEVSDQIAELELEQEKLNKKRSAPNSGYLSGFQHSWNLKELEELKEKEQELKDVRDDANAKVKESEAALKQYGDSLDENARKAGEAGAAQGSAATAVQGMTQAQETAAAATQELTQEQLDAYNELVEGVAGAIGSCISLTSEFNGGQELSTQQMLANLKSQNDGVANWSDNMVKLSHAAGQGMTQGFYEYLLEMGPESANLVQSLVDSMEAKDGCFQELCNEYTRSMNLQGGLSEQLANADLALQDGLNTMGSNVQGRSESDQKTYYDYGLNIVGGIQEGILAKKPAVIATVDQMCADIVAAGRKGLDIHSPSRIMKEQVGVQIPSGVAAGILAGTPAAGKQAAEMAKSILHATEEELEIHSPSKKFKDRVGAQIAKGVAFGVQTNTGQARKSAQALSKQIYCAASSWLSDYKKSHNVSLQDEKYFWEQTAEAAKKGTSGYKKAMKKVASIDSYMKTVREQTKDCFDISKYTTGANGKKQKKSAESYSKEVYKAASSWLDQYSLTHDVSLQKERYFWQKTAATMKKGTSGYKKAIKEMTDIDKYTSTVQKKLKNCFNVSRYTTGSDGKKQKKSTKDYYNEIYSAAASYFDYYSATHDVSLQEEKYYWEQVRKKLKKGTDAYKDATKNIVQLKKQISEEKKQKQEEINNYTLSGGVLDAYKTYYKVSARAETQYWDTVRKKYKKGTAERLEADQKYFEALKNYNEQKEELNEEYYENCKEVHDRLKEEVQELTDAYKDAVKERADSIYSSYNLFDKFESTSESGSTLLYNLKTQVAGYAEWGIQLENLRSRKQLSEGLLEELEEMGPEAAASIMALNSLSNEQLKEYDELWKQKKAISESEAVKQTETLRKETDAAIDELKRTAQAELDALKKVYDDSMAELTAGIEAPLKTLANNAKKYGEDAALSLINGIGSKATKNDTKANLKKVTTTVSSSLGKLKKEGKTIGKDTLQGILDGLTNKKKIKSSAKAMIEALRKEIRAAADIHSPSRLFKKDVGAPITDGVAEGILEEKKKASRAGALLIQDITEKQKEELSRRKKEVSGFLYSAKASAGIKNLNSKTENIPAAQGSGTDLSAFSALLTQMLEIMRENLPNIGKDQMYLDTGELVSATSGKIGTALAMSVKRRR